MAAVAFGFFGVIGGMMIGGMWAGAALLFGFPAPTPDQMTGLLTLLGCGGVVTGAVLTAVFS